ncbi:hypothetical protein AVEN_131838-1 [Araneus ventricosus]|uniref:Uncharacterized protein n=1 Tax=Araneus ventricosus TaxID=182803 RepID=A0A4Y2WVF6_ARAVE|nr:hypothetical protein AVEN_131838-1 [Araneus ventricosus]
MLSSNVILTHDNTRLHFARWTQDILLPFRFDAFDDLPHIPDLAPSDYLPHLQAQGIRPNASRITMHSTMLSKGGFISWRHIFFEEEISNLVKLYDRCLNSNDDCIER